MRKFFAILLFAAIGPGHAGGPEYIVTDLGTLGGDWSRATGISSNGLVAGASSTGIATRAYLYNGGTMQNLGTLPGNISSGDAVNTSGQVTGVSYSAPISGSIRRRAFLYSSGTMQDLGTLGSGWWSRGMDINDSGHVVGSSSTNAQSYEHAFLYGDDVMQDLGSINDTGLSAAFGISNNDLVTGWSRTDNNPSNPIVHAFLYDNGVMQDIGALEPGNNSHGYAVNNLGQVTGDGEIESPSIFTIHHAFLYSGGSMVDIGTLSGNDRSRGLGINNRGDIVGKSFGGGVKGHAFLYSAGVMHDLNSLVVDFDGFDYLLSANDINDNGDIVGVGIVELGGGMFAQRAFVATVVVSLLDVPDVVGDFEAAASASILAADLSVGNVTTATSNTVPAGRVISQNPVACIACANAGDPVDLIVSRGTVPDQVQSLIDEVIGAGLPGGLTTALTAKLQTALNKLTGSNPDNDGAAANALNAFIGLVEAQSGTKIDSVDADALIDAAEAIIAQL